MISSEKWNILIDTISKGMTDKDACLYSGISRESFYSRVRENSDFSDMVKKAQVGFKKKHLETISKAGEKIWQASAWLLERKFKSEFSRTTRNTIIEEDDPKEKMSEEELLELNEKYDRLIERANYSTKSDGELEEIWAKELDRLRKTYISGR